MVINELLKKARALMEGIEYSNPILEPILVLSKLLGVDKVYIYTYGDKEVDDELGRKFIDIMEKRSTGYPLHYLLGEKEFMGLDLHIEEGVLIPRPETEIMVEHIINKIDKEFSGRDINLLDIGIGSGAISLSIARYCPNTRVYGVDLHPKPIEVANINKERLHLSNVQFFQGDLFDPIRAMKPKEKFHIIVSNPPYIRSDDIEGLQIDVKDFEPRTALDGGRDGLDFYRRITREAKEFLLKDGILIYEIGYDQGREVEEIMLGEGFSHIVLLKDFQDHDRIITGVLK